MSQPRSLLLTLAPLLVFACTSASTNDPGPDKPRDGRGPSSPRACPEIAKQPHAEIDLGDGAMRKDGSYAVEVEADGRRESCAIEISGIGPARPTCEGSDCPVQSPTTRTSTTCELVTVSGIQSDGSIKYLATVGTPKKLSLTLTHDGATLASGTVEPAYEPDECGFIEPIVTLGKP